MTVSQDVTVTVNNVNASASTIPQYAPVIVN